MQTLYEDRHTSQQASQGQTVFIAGIRNRALPPTPRLAFKPLSHWFPTLHARHRNWEHGFRVAQGPGSSTSLHVGLRWSRRPCCRGTQGQAGWGREEGKGASTSETYSRQTVHPCCMSHCTSDDKKTGEKVPDIIGCLAKSEEQDGWPRATYVLVHSVSKFPLLIRIAIYRTINKDSFWRNCESAEYGESQIICHFLHNTWHQNRPHFPGF